MIKFVTLNQTVTVITRVITRIGGNIVLWRLYVNESRAFFITNLYFVHIFCQHK